MALELLGEVRTGSGAVLLIDMGLLNLWSHDRPPLMPDGILEAGVTATANSARDFRAEGADAERACRLLDRQRTPRHVFDIPTTGVEELQHDFAAVVSAHRLEAALMPVVPRVSHLARTRLVGDGGEFLMHGVPCVAVTTAPIGRELSVWGDRNGDRWSWVALAFQRDAVVAHSELLGSVGVDWARLMFVDPVALGVWKHEAPMDGRADFLFWGRDAEAVAQRFHVPPLGGGQFGFLSGPIEEVARRAAPIDDLRSEGSLKFATDFRPHSHHWQLMEQVRASSTESGTLELEGTKCCAFMTSWGDGIFQVSKDLDAAGNTVGISIDFEAVPR